MQVSLLYLRNFRRNHEKKIVKKECLNYKNNEKWKEVSLTSAIRMQSVKVKIAALLQLDASCRESQQAH